MPLQLGDVTHEREQLILFDPQVYEEAAEARRKYKQLRKHGFTLKAREPGKLELRPPSRDPHKGLFRILSKNGDDHVVWDRRDPTQVREAYKKFSDFIKKGYTAYATTGAGKKGHRIDDFDPGLEEIILVPGTMPG